MFSCNSTGWQQQGRKGIIRDIENYRPATVATSSPVGGQTCQVIWTPQIKVTATKLLQIIIPFDFRSWSRVRYILWAMKNEPRWSRLAVNSNKKLNETSHHPACGLRAILFALNGTEPSYSSSPDSNSQVAIAASQGHGMRPWKPMQLWAQQQLFCLRSGSLALVEAQGLDPTAFGGAPGTVITAVIGTGCITVTRIGSTGLRVYHGVPADGKA